MGVMTVVATAGSRLASQISGRKDTFSDQLSYVRPNERDAEAGARRPLLESPPLHRTSSGRSYGATEGAQSSSSHRVSPERLRHDASLDRVPEEGEGVDFAAGDEGGEESDEEEWELEEMGLYVGSYRRILWLYSFVPFTALAALLLFAFIPPLIWRTPWASHPTTHPPHFGPLLPELLISAALYALSHLLRIPLYTFSSLLTFSLPIPTTLLSTALHAALHTALRLAAFPLLRLRHDMVYVAPTWRDPAFARAWGIALGWAVADAGVSVVQGYSQLALYRGVLVPRGLLARLRQQSQSQPQSHSASGSRQGSPLSPSTATVTGLPRESAPAREHPVFAHSRVGEESGKGSVRSQQELLDMRPNGLGAETEVERDLDQLVALRAREEFEEVCGVPAIRIPVFISCLQRLNAVLLCLGYTLILSSAYLDSPLSWDIPPHRPRPPPNVTNRPFAIAFPVVTVLTFLLALLHTPPILPRIGMHVAAYVALLVGLGALFVGLGMWGALA